MWLLQQKTELTSDLHENILNRKPLELDGLYFLNRDIRELIMSMWKVVKTWLNTESVFVDKCVTKADVQNYKILEDLQQLLGRNDIFEYNNNTSSTASESISSTEESMKKDKKVHFGDAQEHVLSKQSLETSRRRSETDSTHFDSTAKTSAHHFHRTHSHNSQSDDGNTNNNADRNDEQLELETDEVKVQQVEVEETPVGEADTVEEAESVEETEPSGEAETVGETEAEENAPATASEPPADDLFISPANRLMFKGKGIQEEYQDADAQNYDTITLMNTLPNPVAFKVKTTAPEKFRVRPSFGHVASNSTKEILVYLVAEEAGELNRDKFLIMAVEVPDSQQCGDPQQLVKNAPKENILQHKLGCALIQDNEQVKQSRSSHSMKQQNPLESRAANESETSAEMLSLSLTASLTEAQAKKGSEKASQGATPARRTSAKGTCAAGTPATGTSAKGTPATGTPAKGTPRAGTPAEKAQQERHSQSKKQALVKTRRSQDRSSVLTSQEELSQTRTSLETFSTEETSYEGTIEKRKILDSHFTECLLQLSYPSKQCSPACSKSNYDEDDSGSKSPTISDIDQQVDQLEMQTTHMQKKLNLLLIIQFMTAIILILIMLSYSCFGEDIFTQFLALPFDFCHVPCGRKCK